MEELQRLPPAAWLLIAAAAALGLLLFWTGRWYRGYRARKSLRAAVTAGCADHLRNSLVPDGMGGSFHVDFLLLTLRGVVVIDLRDVKGNIFGGDQMAEWTVMDGARRVKTMRPSTGTSPAETMTRFRDGWQSLRNAVKPSNMADMR